MKNLKTKTKLLASFIALAVMAAAVGAVGICSILTLNERDSEMYDTYVLAISSMGDMRETYQMIRGNLRRVAIACELEDQSDYRQALENGERYIKEMNAALDDYASTALDAELEANFWNAKKAFEGPYLDEVKRILATAASTRSAQATYKAILDAADEAAAVESYIEACEDDNVRWAKALSDSNTWVARLASGVQIGVMLLAVGAAIFMAFYISSLITKPLAHLHMVLSQAGGTGDLRFPKEVDEGSAAFSQAKDEVGQCILAMDTFMKKVIYYGGALGAVADRDLTVRVEKISGQDTIGNALEKMVGELGSMFAEIRQASEQVTAGAAQIADGAQSLAAGATEQAATVQQLSGSINDVSAMTAENAEKASHAAELSAGIRESAQKGAERMGHMLEAVREINQASTEISKVIKSIDDIAFQTNILALNAAVEAARAGQHGKGFAVVADEVRNLAAKSAEAAKDTGALIENSIAKASLGAKIADETSASLTEIVGGVNESAEIIQQIAAASEEQSVSIKNITVGVGQIAAVVQNNSATAEESAAASEEMSGQSALLNEMVSRFRITGAGYALAGGGVAGISLDGALARY